MRCPKCGSRIPNESPICFKCGTRLTQITEASFGAVKEAKKTYQPEKIVHTTIFPKDLSYTNTLLMCIFLGFFGGHYFYIQKYPRAIVSLIFSAFFMACVLIPGFIVGFNHDVSEILMTFYFDPIPRAIFVFSCMGAAILTCLWVIDIIKIAFKKFKVPVVLKEI